MKNQTKQLDKNYQGITLKTKYESCFMPILLDDYTFCSYNCLYCDANARKSINLRAKKQGNIVKHDSMPLRTIDPDLIKKVFTAILNGGEIPKTYKFLEKYVKNKKMIQFGTVSDPFCNNEKKYGVTYELLEFFDEIDYPLTFCSKGSMYTKPKYLNIIKNHSHNWHFRIAISTSNDLIARKVERGVPSPTERFNNIKKLSKNGIKVTHIIRPLIPGYSDVKGLVTKAKMSGAYACKIRDLLVKPVLPEFYKKRMLKLSEITGVDLYELYTKKSQEERDKILQPYYDEFIETCRKLKLYYACNKSRQIYTPSYCCCAIPPEMHKYLYFGNFTHAVEQAQRRKSDIITFKDVGKYSKECFKGVESEVSACIADSRSKAQTLNMDCHDFTRWCWNKPRKVELRTRNHVEKVGVDENGDNLYRVKELKGWYDKEE